MSTLVHSESGGPGGTNDSGYLAPFADEEARLDGLLAYTDPWTWQPWRWRQARDGARDELTQRARVHWSDDIRDPEFQKNVRIFRRLVVGAAGVYERCRCRRRAPQPRVGDRNPEHTPTPEVLDCRWPEMRRRISLPDDRPLTLKLLLGYRFALEQLLVELGDPEYIHLRAVELHSEGEGTAVTWRQMFPGVDLPFDNTSSSNATRRRVGQLLAAKELDDHPLRARRELKVKALYGLLPFFVLSAVVFAVLLALWSDSATVPFLAAAAGANGAALGMLLKLRDDVKRGAQVREFMPFSLAQLLVGASAGLLVTALGQGELINLSGAHGVAAFSFAVGFSEAAFLGLLGRVTEVR